ncbi:unnamed protein product [Anisakis simplex]|uniref:Uncharacterized protein n=1 Tax=Anisakis simplex TaxID=6269 RepID=A0A3P6SPK0_ANISI|nr:unnamed protein product [Anisakis simplex]
MDISDLGGMRCDALSGLSDDDLPHLRFLQLHRTRVNEELLWALNLKRPHLMITNRHDYFINWDIRDEERHLNENFNGDMNRVLNDLEESDGFCCMCNPVLDYYE